MQWRNKGFLPTDTDERLCDGRRRRRSLLSNLQPDDVCGQHRERRQVDASSVADDTAQLPRQEDVVRDPDRAGRDHTIDAGD